MRASLLLAGLTPSVGLFLATSVLAERETVLKQIDVPHNYYYREMYLPQLTSGPSSLSWSPDGSSLVYAMQGSLWRQEVGSSVAVQLTASSGYDFQPDWSPDGTRIAFVRYENDAVELHILDVATGTTTALTSEGAVNLEPRWSPDGSKLAFVSTRDAGRFHIFTGDVIEDSIHAHRMIDDRKSEVSRYYYSTHDHELSPAWSPDGTQLLYISNPETPYGTGAIWRRSLAGDSEPRLVRMEETSWRARPDWSPDGKRVAYASYLGRQWHQLWVTTAEGIAEPFPLTYGDFDVTSPRWSPDGKQIAYIANESSILQIRIQALVGGKITQLNIAERQFIKPVATLRLRVVDGKGQSVPARIAVVASNGRSYAPDDSRLHADDGFDRSNSEFETKYFHLDGESILTLPAGTAHVTVWRGLEHQIRSITIDVSAGQESTLSMELQALDTPSSWNDWVSGDVHVHMNYGGTYRNTPAKLARQAAAEDLDILFNLIVNKEQRVPDIAYFSTEPDVASDEDTLISHAQEFHTSFWGHIGLLGLNSHLLIPDYSAYPGTAAASIFPDNTTIARLAHEQNALVGYVHPFDPPAPNPATDVSLSNAFPVDVALGLVDYYEVVGFADARTTATVWYRLLNCGMRVTAAGGTDAMANYASLRGPVGMNRTYAYVPDLSHDPATRQDQWLGALKAGNTIATNGPIIGLNVDGHSPGAQLKLPAGSQELSFEGFLRSIVPVDHLELVMNGEVVRTFAFGDSRTSLDVSGSILVEHSGWLLLRAWNEDANPLIFDQYPYATTTPVYVSVGDEVPRSTADADYFIAWISRIREAVQSHSDYNSDSERDSILANLSAAEREFEACRVE